MLHSENEDELLRKTACQRCIAESSNPSWATRNIKKSLENNLQNRVFGEADFLVRTLSARLQELLPGMEPQVRSKGQRAKEHFRPPRQPLMCLLARPTSALADGRMPRGNVRVKAASLGV